MSEYQNMAGGERVRATAYSPIIDPALLEQVGQAPVSSLADVDHAVTSAHRAFHSGQWARSRELRQAGLAGCASVLAEHEENLATLLSREQGKALMSARLEIRMAARILAYFSTYEHPQKIVRDNRQEKISVLNTPLGAVGLIVPWNYPITILMMKLGPALAAGNTAVIKPAPNTPLTTLRMAELFDAILPAGVINTLTGEGDVGAALVEHPLIQKISFTGSTPTGVRVMSGAAKTLKRLTLELGGNDAAIVLADARPEDIATKIYGSVFTNAGQICCAIKRLYVHKSIVAETVDRLAQIAREWRVGPGLHDNIQMGPVNNQLQLRHVQDLLREAKARGGNIVTGGEGLADFPGYFLRPTIVTGIDDDARLVKEEQFGPALPILAFDDEDEAVARANNSPFGLGASVWSADVEHACVVAQRLEAGNIYVNQHAVPPDPEVPFGGTKTSGFGHELGSFGYDDFCHRRIFSIALTAGATP